MKTLKLAGWQADGNFTMVIPSKCKRIALGITIDSSASGEKKSNDYYAGSKDSVESSQALIKFDVIFLKPLIVTTPYNVNPL